MRRTIVIKDSESKKELRITTEVPNKDHLETQKKYRHNVVRSKKVYDRKSIQKVRGDDV